MLKHLYIKNFALIKELDLDLCPGFSVITGETGAGKSIILGAISLLLGQKADAKNILSGSDKCVIECTFDITGYELESMFRDNDLDYDADECVIRREFTAAGKSRAFVNDSPANIAFLKQVGFRLIDIHSQHQNLLLADEDYQLNILDVTAQDNVLLKRYRNTYNEYKRIERELGQTIKKVEDAKKEQDYLAYQLEQLKALLPRENEDEELAKEQNELSHAEEIKSTLYNVCNIFSNDSDDGGVLEQTKRICGMLDSLASISPGIKEYHDRVESALIELKDICSEIEEMSESVEYNPQKLEEITARLDQLYSLEQKHNVDSSNGLRLIMDELKTKLNGISDGEERIEALQEELETKKKEAYTLATKLSAERSKAAKKVETYVTKTLVLLDMPHNNFKVFIENTGDITPNGTDNVTFMFSANKNMEPRKIAQVASGGEIARVMLALKAITSKNANLPTIIFDEIDTGVSGKVADSMAALMQEMGNIGSRQVIAITHLPQIASKGDRHYWVYKEDSTDKTISHIRQLSGEERIQEIAHMLSGNRITEAAIENAKQLLGK